MNAFLSPPIVLTVAGSDCSGGAGIQTDLKTFAAHGCYGMSAVTSVVSEIPDRVDLIENLSPEMVRSQLSIVLENCPVAAVKSGMLPTAGIILACADVWGALAVRPPLVIDPVMVSGGGTRLIDEDAVEAMIGAWIPFATVVTPNSRELAAMTGLEVASLQQLKVAAAELNQRTGVAILAKGGHLDEQDAVDMLCQDGEFFEFRKPRIPGGGLHGTGCTLSAAIASGLSRGLDLETAVSSAKEFLHAAIVDRLGWADGALQALNTLPR